MHESSANCEEFIPMANVPETIDITKVKIVYGGDMMSLFAVLGLNGPNAAFPCISCEVTKQELVEGKTGTIRTLANLNHNHSLFDRKDPTNDRCKSCVRRPIVKTEVENNIVPLPLHIFIGLVNRLWKAGEAKMIELDKGKQHKLDGDHKSFHERWKATTRLMGVRLAKHHGGQLTGDACARMLRGQYLLQGVFKILGEPHDEETWAIQYLSLIGKLHFIHRRIMRPTPLCVHEMKDVSETVVQFGQEWRSFFDGNATPKLHQLEIHVPLFLRKHSSIGMCSEQSLERQHKVWNRFDTIYRTLGDEEDKLRSMIKQSHLQSSYDVIIHSSDKENRR